MTFDEFLEDLIEATKAQAYDRDVNTLPAFAFELARIV